MKQLKFLMIAFTLLMGFSLTSCLNSNSDSLPQVGGFVKVNDLSFFGTEFVYVDGVTKIYPTVASLSSMEGNMGFKASSTNIAFVQGTYDETVNPNPIENKEFKDVNLSYAISLDAKILATERGADNDSVNGAPIIDIDNSKLISVGGETHKPWFFYDKTTLMLPINYYLYKAGAHKFTLIYYPADNNSVDTTLKLYLRHYNADDKSTSANSMNNSGEMPFIYYYAYDLTSIFGSYARATGISEYPSSITIEYVTNPSDLDLTKAETKTIVVERKSITEKN